MASRRTIRHDEVARVYKQTWAKKIPWEEMHKKAVLAWLQVFDIAECCNINMLMPALLTLTGTFAGPKSRVRLMEDGLTSSLNMYIFNVCDPSGGKSIVFGKVVESVLDSFKEDDEEPLNVKLENYTSAGLQAHQKMAKGYGMITADEGTNIMTAIRYKESKGESERGLFCKMWGGKGDSANLVTGERGFTNTSMCVFIPIQPVPFLNDLMQMSTSNDGFLDRFLFVVCKPKRYSSAQIKKNQTKLKDSGVINFIPTFKEIFHLNREGVTYTLDKEGQLIFDQLNDEATTLINEIYKSDSDDEGAAAAAQDVNLLIPGTAPGQTNNLDFSSKDIIHLLRLSCLFHILLTTLDCQIKQIPVQIPTEINVKFVTFARKILGAVSEQKSYILESIQGPPDENRVSLAKVRSRKERVCRAICRLNGPLVTMNQIQRHVKGSVVLDLKVDLQSLVEEGFGSVYTTEDRYKSVVFMKPSPDTFTDETDGPMKSYGISHELYRVGFNKTDHLTERLTDICKHHHPHREIMDTILTPTQPDSD